MNVLEQLIEGVAFGGFICCCLLKGMAADFAGILSLVAGMLLGVLAGDLSGAALSGGAAGFVGIVLVAREMWIRRLAANESPDGPSLRRGTELGR